MDQKISVKTFIMLQNISISTKCCSFESSIQKRLLNNMQHNIVYIKLYIEQHISILE